MSNQQFQLRLVLLSERVMICFSLTSMSSLTYQLFEENISSQLSLEINIGKLSPTVPAIQDLRSLIGRWVRFPHLDFSRIVTASILVPDIMRTVVVAILLLHEICWLQMVLESDQMVCLLPNNTLTWQKLMRRGKTTGRENRSRHGRPRDTCKQPSTKQVWAEPAGLVTTRRAKDLEEKTKKAEEKKKYLRKPVDEERILTYVSTVNVFDSTWRIY